MKRRTPASTFAACRVHIGEGSWGSLWSIGEYFPCKFVTFVALARVKMKISVWCWKMEEVQYLNLVMRKHILFCMRVEYSWLRKHVKPRSRFSKINLVIITWNKGISYVSQTQQKTWSQTSLCSRQVTQRSLSLACPGIKIPPGKDHQVPPSFNVVIQSSTMWPHRLQNFQTKIYPWKTRLLGAAPAHRCPCQNRVQWLSRPPSETLANHTWWVNSTAAFVNVM